jgi:hypothetical protein
MSHQIEQLKEEITAKDHALVKEHFDHAKVEKEKEGTYREKKKNMFFSFTFFLNFFNF